MAVGFSDESRGLPSLTEHNHPFSTASQALLDECCRQLDEYFQGKRRRFTLPMVIEGTVFQKKVWQQLLSIPYGKTVSYREVANAINHPQASRGVGAACHRNKLEIIIPCHRVIGSNGHLTGYAGGLERKQLLLELEEKNMKTVVI